MVRKLNDQEYTLGHPWLDIQPIAERMSATKLPTVKALRSFLGHLISMLTKYMDNHSNPRQFRYSNHLFQLFSKNSIYLFSYLGFAAESGGQVLIWALLIFIYFNVSCICF